MLFCSTGSPGESGVYKGQRLFLLKTAPTQLVRRYDPPKLCYVRSRKTACKCCLLLTDCCVVSCSQPSSDFWRVDATLWSCSLSADDYGRGGGADGGQLPQKSATSEEVLPARFRRAALISAPLRAARPFVFHL